MLYSFIRPALFCLDAENAHELAMSVLRMHPGESRQKTGGPLAVDVAGLKFPNPVGLAAGFDKNAEVPDALLSFGFGFAEVGTLTPLAQDGNPRPRMFRLTPDRAVINRLGFNNQGGDAAAGRLLSRLGKPGIVGVNIGANRQTRARIGDYALMARLMAPLASYLAVNVSSPNTPGLRALQDKDVLGDLIDAVLEGRVSHGPPVFLKVAPDLEPGEIDDIARIALDRKLGALIVSNTTISRPPLLSPEAQEAGGLSGAPLRDLAQQRLRDFRKATGGAIPLIGVGGIATADDAWARIRAGASLVQLYSAMIYQGPWIAQKINRRLKKLMKRDGFTSIAEAVGSE
jgi:dihydroorotate dehydrogenase